MVAGVDIRPLRDDDVAAADRVCMDVLFSVLPGDDEDARLARSHARIRHLAETDPGGAWVAERDGEVAGVALALVREGVWGFSLFGVVADLQGRGVGRALFERCWALRGGCARHLILSSENPGRDAQLRGQRPGPAAVRRRRRDRRPRARARPRPRRGRRRRPAIAIADAIGRELRGAGHGRDLPVVLAHGGRLLVLEDRAFVLDARRGRWRCWARATPTPRGACCGPASPPPDRARR